jgi:hypothetical protein
MASSNLTTLTGTTHASVGLANATYAGVVSGGITGIPAVLPIGWELNGIAPLTFRKFLTFH